VRFRGTRTPSNMPQRTARIRSPPQPTGQNRGQIVAHPVGHITRAPESACFGVRVVCSWPAPGLTSVKRSYAFVVHADEGAEVDQVPGAAAIARGGGGGREAPVVLEPGSDLRHAAASRMILGRVVAGDGRGVARVRRRDGHAKGVRQVYDRQRTDDAVRMALSA